MPHARTVLPAGLALLAVFGLCSCRAETPAPASDPRDCAGGRLDESTGLCWQHPPARGSAAAGFTREQASGYCAGLDLAGHRDWRLPGRRDFVDLLQGCDAAVLEGDVGECNSCAASATCAPLFGPDRGWYWSATPMDGEPGIAWDVRFDLGLLLGGAVDDRSGVRCVRATR